MAGWASARGLAFNTLPRHVTNTTTYSRRAAYSPSLGRAQRAKKSKHLLILPDNLPQPDDLFTSSGLLTLSNLLTSSSLALSYRRRAVGISERRESTRGPSRRLGPRVDSSRTEISAAEGRLPSRRTVLARSAESVRWLGSWSSLHTSTDSTTYSRGPAY